MSTVSTVFANGIWKSGNHLLIKILGRVGFDDANFGIASSSLHGRYYIARQVLRGALLRRDPIMVGLDATAAVSDRWIRRQLHAHRGACIGGHAAYSDHLLALLHEAGVFPIQIVRDPRDVVCSFSHWIVRRPDYYAFPAFKDLSVDQRMLALIRGGRSGKVFLESLATVMDRSFGWLTRPDEVLVVKFEDLVGAEGGGSRQRQDEAIASIVRWVGVRGSSISEISADLFGGTATFRRGQTNTWKDEFSDEVTAVFRSIVGDRLSEWGYAW